MTLTHFRQPFSLLVFFVCLLEVILWSQVATCESDSTTDYLLRETDIMKEFGCAEHGSEECKQVPIYIPPTEERVNTITIEKPESLSLLQNSSLILLGGIILTFLTAALIIFPAKTKKVASYLSHPTELIVLFYYLFFYKKAKIPKDISPSAHFCFHILTKVSRSFSAVIFQLTPELRDPICIFYLVLRGLDTIEDDMSIPVDKKLKLLKDFANHLEEPGWNSKEGYGAANPHEMKLLEEFDKVIEVYSQLKPLYQSTIKDITIKMANGMSDFLQRKVETKEDYELYCHYVAGLVGIGLSKLFHHSGLEGSRFANLDTLSNSMGLFLQKTNITRDYLEDINEKPPRVFYPKEIWGKYAENIEDFKDPKKVKKAVGCLNHMITDALKHISDCLDYLYLVKEPSVFKFCAIPQVMAIATLERCYNNPAVFSSEVKIRKGEAVQLMIGSTDYISVCNYFQYYVNLLEKKIPIDDPNKDKAREYLQKANQKIQVMKKK